MKKVLIASLCLAFGSTAFAATTNKALAAGSNTVDKATSCPLLSEDVKVTLSTGNIGNVSCDSTTANIGVAVGNTSGKGKIYSVGSNGGKITETATTGGAAPDATAVGTQADARSAETS